MPGMLGKIGGINILGSQGKLRSQGEAKGSLVG